MRRKKEEKKEEKELFVQEKFYFIAGNELGLDQVRVLGQKTLHKKLVNGKHQGIIINDYISTHDCEPRLVCTLGML